MKITTTTTDLFGVLESKIAVISADIREGEAKAKRLEPDAEQSESAKKALTVIRASIERAAKLRQSMVQMARSIQRFHGGARVELNDNESAVLGYVDSTEAAP